MSVSRLLGLAGLSMKIERVRGVIAASSCSAVMRKPPGCLPTLVLVFATACRTVDAGSVGDTLYIALEVVDF